MTAASRRGPLAGRRVLVTRAAGQSTGLVEELRRRGADVVEVPLLDIGPPAEPQPFLDAVRRLGEYRWLVLTSGNAARAVADAIGPDARLPKALSVATSGPATTDVVRSLFPATPIAAQPTRRFGSPGLAEALALVDLAGARVLLPVSDRSPAAIARTLRERGAAVDVVVAYRTIVAADAGPALRAALETGMDAVTLASPSAVEAFVGLRGPSPGVPAVVIGPTTASAAASQGLEVAETAEPETAEGLADAVQRCLLGRRETS